ncbi:hypothetical protein TNCV_5071951 [Trichonephila clavipes]|nr:hypothetical protein TNCV_5071951 [Trichonephila clavipes]
MPDDNVVKKILQIKVTGIRKRGKLRLRGADSGELNFEIINEKTLGEQKSIRVHYGGIFKGRQWLTKSCLATYDDETIKMAEIIHNFMDSIDIKVVLDT